MLGLARAVDHAAGLGHTARLLCSGLVTVATYQRMVPCARFMIQCGLVVAVRLSCHQRTLSSVMKAREMNVRLASLGPWLVQRAWGPSPACPAKGLRSLPIASAWYCARALCESVRSVEAVRLSCL